ncbi:MAG: VWA domain-containing protein [Candidatus Omnitrophica bacterium]|nr:VWA domain-containing protein [Candidatus Omnitrophota bacterium]
MGSFSPRLRLVKRALFLSALFFIVLALAQPHFRTKETLVERKGVDVMIAVDVSNSMLGRDISPNRLEKSKLELAGLIDRLRGDRIGIVAFAGDAVIQCPLTLDKNAAKLFLSTISPSLIPAQGTAIAKAIDTSSRAFSGKEKEFKAIVILTDGEDHEGDPLAAARRAREEGARIFTIGIGTPDGSTLPVEYGQGIKRDRTGRIVLSKLNETLLENIAKVTGGIYTRASRGEIAVDRIAGEIRRMTKKGLKKEKSVEYEENYQVFLVPAYLLLLVQWALTERRKEW